jgi:hypothetical protein
LLNTVRVEVAKSDDNDYHVRKRMISRGSNPVIANNLAEKINFPISQTDTVLFLPAGFSISKNERWRNQRVLIIVKVPVGKRFMLDKQASEYDYFNVRYNRRHGFRIDDDYGESYWVEPGKEYIMTPDGSPKLVAKLDAEALSRGEYKEREKDVSDKEALKRDLKKRKAEAEDRDHEIDQLNRESDSVRGGGGYRYQRKTKETKKDTASAKVQSI